MAAQKPDIHEIFNEAILRDSSEERSQYLNDACGTNAEARQRVDALLCSHSEAGGFLGGQEFSTENLDFAEKIGKQIGPYKLREKIGEGGFGVVYVAEQKEPVSRKVALKVIKPGMDSKDIIARFEAERQALAMMDHPNVAKVLDAGSTDDGRPYFVMELVKGDSITEACDQARLNNRQRLELFVEVCNAVQHAHQKGIIHRDLKPSNVMVTASGDRMIPKVIDFGVAKALHQNLTDKSIYTAYGQLIGTPMYMSPEQAQLSSLDVDTRSDIYSLGVLLYELLTGTTPFDKETFKQAGFDEVRRIIREDEPRRPSDQVTTLHAEIQSTVSEKRRVDHRTLSRSLRGELDWIVMKTLEKDRNRRYETANALSDDLQRFMKNEPVLACPPSTLYRFHKFATRNKAGLRLAAVAALGLTALIIGLFVNNRMIENQKQVTQKALNESNQLLEHVKLVHRIINGLFSDMDINEIREGNEPLEAVLSHRMTNAASLIANVPEQDSLTVAETQSVLGDALQSLGYQREAIEIHRASFVTRKKLNGPNDPDTLRSLTALAVSTLNSGDIQAGLPLAVEAFETCRKELGDQDSTTLIALNALAFGKLSDGALDESIRLFELQLELCQRHLGPEDETTIYSMRNLGTIYGRVDRDAESAELLRKAATIATDILGQTHLTTLTLLDDQVGVLIKQGLDSKAYELSKEILERKKAKLGEQHPSTLLSLRRMAECSHTFNRMDEAVELYEEALGRFEAKYGSDNYVTIHTMFKLGEACKDQGQLDRAISLLDTSIELMETNPEFHQKDIYAAKLHLARAHYERGNREVAVSLFEQVIEWNLTNLGAAHPSTLGTMLALATAYNDSGNHKNAINLVKPIVAELHERDDVDNAALLKATKILTETYFNAGKLNEAVSLSDDLIELLDSTEMLDGDETAIKTRSLLAGIYYRLDRPGEAASFLEWVISHHEDRLGREHPLTQAVLLNLGSVLNETARLDEALTILEEVYGNHRSTRGFEYCVPCLADSYIKNGRTEQAAQTIRLAWSELKAELEDSNAMTMPVKERLRNLARGNVLLRIDDADLAVEILQEYHRMMKEEGRVDVRMGSTSFNLGVALAAKGNYSDAELFLIPGYQGLVEKAAELSPKFKQSWARNANLLVSIYRSAHLRNPDSGFDHEVAEWQERIQRWNR